jgi:hypothetical protein
MTIIVDFIENQFLVKQYGKDVETYPLTNDAMSIAKAVAEIGWEVIVKPTHIEYRLR